MRKGGSAAAQEKCRREIRPGTSKITGANARTIATYAPHGRRRLSKSLDYSIRSHTFTQNKSHIPRRESSGAPVPTPRHPRGLERLRTRVGWSPRRRRGDATNCQASMRILMLRGAPHYERPPQPLPPPPPPRNPGFRFGSSTSKNEESGMVRGARGPKWVRGGAGWPPGT